MINWITQTLTTAPLWVQAPVVFAVVVPLCVLLALVLVRGVDVVAGLVDRWTTGRRIGRRDNSN